MCFNPFLLSCLLLFLPIMAREQRSIEESNWKKGSGWPPLTSIADYQLPPPFHSPSIPCILKCISQVSCAAVCIYSESRCRLYTSDCTKDLIVTQASVSETTTQTSSEQDKDRMHAENAVNCSESENIFRTRGHSNKCRPIRTNHPTLSSTEDETRGRMTRILMLSTVGPQEPGRQLYLDDKSVVPYPFIQARSVSAIAYIPSHKTVVVATTFPNILILSHIDENKETKINKDLQVPAIAIDDEKQLVFLKVIYPGQGVSVMSARVKNIRSLIDMRLMHCFLQSYNGLVTDHKRSLIYVLCFRMKILQFTYQGVARGSVVGTGNVPFSLHMQGDFLYYQKYTESSRYVLHKVSLSNNSVTVFTTSQIPHGGLTLTVGNILYVLPYVFKGDLFVVNMTDMGTVTKVNVGFLRKPKKVTMCLIP